MEMERKGRKNPILAMAPYNLRDVTAQPGDDCVGLDYIDVFNCEVSEGVKNGVEYLGEVFYNMQTAPLNAHYYEIPITKNRESLGAWLFTVMVSKCKVTATGEKGCHELISTVV